MEFKALEKIELMKFLIENLKKQSRTNIKTLLSKEQILVNGKVERQYNYLLSKDDIVTVDWNKNRNDKTPKGIRVIYEDKSIIVVEKESGILSISTENKKNERTVYKLLMDYVKGRNERDRVFIVHRLDKDTSGVMLFAKTEEIKTELQENWKDIVKEREYAVIVEGILKSKTGQVKSYLKDNKAFVTYSVKDDKTGGKLAVTNYRVEKTKGKFTYLKALLETGRKNQIRVHMSDIGHPVIGDKKYGAQTNPIKRLGLHAHTLKFIHPVTKQEMCFTSDIPQEFKRIIGE
ncbi:RluA family pseudouridine synthase [uncultured Cetobacterium sp.]|uniref:RluA family pseudouridine synthase n=1 Tax=uncultured Cetobacterium sp. TaxID=527638 RepID=UPI002602030B|nr:RluA family pseudouridine synthase [uncultured Cetobacterium sp.]